MEDIAQYTKAASYIAAAIVMGIGTIGPAFAQGNVGAKACENMGKYPEAAQNIRNSMILAIGFIETSAIYAFMTAGAILYFGR